MSTFVFAMKDSEEKLMVVEASSVEAAMGQLLDKLGIGLVRVVWNESAKLENSPVRVGNTNVVPFRVKPSNGGQNGTINNAG